MKRKKIDIDLLGIGKLLKGFQHLLFPAAAGTDLMRDIVEAGAEADAIEARAEKRPSQGPRGNAKREE